MGSKSRIAKHIVPIIQHYINSNNIENYLEPFVGGANIIDKIVCKNRYGSDISKYLIALYQNIDKIAFLPEFVTKDHYSEVREDYNNKTKIFEDWYIGAIGFLASYNGRFFDGGYAGVVNTKAGTIRNYYDEAKRNLEAQIESLEGIVWKCADYKDIKPVKDFVIYCDIPYMGTKQYNTSKNFDYNCFWEWARRMSVNNIVLVSECQAPDDFQCVWEQEILRTVDNTKRVKSIEKLFIYKTVKLSAL